METYSLAAVLKNKVKDFHCAMCQETNLKNNAWRMYNGQFYHIYCIQEH